MNESFELYSAAKMHRLLKVSHFPSLTRVTDKGGRQYPNYYTSLYGPAFVGPPSSDTPGCQLETITEVLTYAKDALTGTSLLSTLCQSFPNQYSEKLCLILPVAEERGILWGQGPRRNHWVTLHYNLSTRTATVIDSRPESASPTYPSHHIHELLDAALTEMGLQPVKKFVVRCTGVQLDHTHCGPWTVAYIELLAHGYSITDTINTLKNMSSNDIVQHHHYREHPTPMVKEEAKTSHWDNCILCRSTFDAELNAAMDRNAPLKDEKSRIARDPNTITAYLDKLWSHPSPTSKIAVATDTRSSNPAAYTTGNLWSNNTNPKLPEKNDEKEEEKNDKEENGYVLVSDNEFILISSDGEMQQTSEFGPSL